MCSSCLTIFFLSSTSLYFSLSPTVLLSYLTASEMKAWKMVTTAYGRQRTGCTSYWSLDPFQQSEGKALMLHDMNWIYVPLWERGQLRWEYAGKGKKRSKFAVPEAEAVKVLRKGKIRKNWHLSALLTLGLPDSKKRAVRLRWETFGASPDHMKIYILCPNKSAEINLLLLHLSEIAKSFPYTAV